MTAIKEEEALDALLAASSKECFDITDEDREWIDEKPEGKEIITPVIEK